MKKIITLLLLTIPIVIFGTVYTVKQDGTGDFETIYDALYSTQIQQNGGTIYVFPGVYSEGGIFIVNLHDIELIGVDQETCIVDGGSYVFEIVNVNSNLLIRNFTIRNGSLAGFKIYGISLGNTSIENNMITECGYYSQSYEQKSAILCYGNANIINNTFENNHNYWHGYLYQESSLGGAIYVNFHDNGIDDGYVNILNNEFISNFAADAGAIYCTSNQTLKINNNYFEGNCVEESSLQPWQYYPGWCCIGKFEDCNEIDFIGNICFENLSFVYPYVPPQDCNGLVFEDCNNANILNNTINQNLSPYGVDSGLLGIIIDANYVGDYVIKNNIIINNRMGIVCFDDYYNSLIIDYNDVWNNPPPPNSGDYNYFDVIPGIHDISVDPELESGTFRPLWISNVKSPCIDTGDPASPVDPDGTPADMGAVCAITHKYDIVELPSPEEDDGWKWLSFPTLDDLYSIPTYDPDVAHYLLADIMAPPYPAALDSVLVQEYKIYYQYPDWLNEYEQFYSTQGFKFHMNEAATLEVPGFKEPDNTAISLTGDDEENWIGYWLEEEQHVSDAFSEYWDGSNIHFIQHQKWTAFYLGRWRIMLYGSCEEPTLSYGDMVVVKCEEDILNFRWDNSTPEDERTVYPETEYFSFEEQADYTPIYIELDKNNIPQEIGAFVNGECIGAVVVEDTLVQINAYTTSVPPGNIELELYYGGRSENQHISSYNCVTSSKPNIIMKQLSTKKIDDAWFIDLREDSSMVPAPTKVSLSNYPNPFNPTTTISYSLPQEGKISLKIYNVKGQLVKQLIDGYQPEGYSEVVWNGKNNAGRSVASGIYYCRITACGKTINKKMLLLK